MNAVTKFQFDNPSLKVMNLLQESAICSDNCVSTEDIAREDLDNALTFLDCALYAQSFGG